MGEDCNTGIFYLQPGYPQIFCFYAISTSPKLLASKVVAQIFSPMLNYMPRSGVSAEPPRRLRVKIERAPSENCRQQKNYSRSMKLHKKISSVMFLELMFAGGALRFKYLRYCAALNIGSGNPDAHN